MVDVLTNERFAMRRPQTGNDGGVWSLSGYLYQLLGSAAKRASLDDFRTSTTVDATVTFELEHEGQDARVDAGGLVRLVQFKYSLSGWPILPAELAAVLRTLKQSTSSHLPKTSVTWILATNRPLSPVAQQLLNQAQRSARRSGSSPRPPRNAPAAVIRSLGARLTVQPCDADHFEEVLLAEAAKFGIEDQQGILDRVVSLMQRTAVKVPGRRGVTRDALSEALAGYKRPRSIRAQDCLGTLRQELQDIALEQGLSLEHAIPRAGIEALLTRTDSALAIVYGRGGCGKTLSLLKALDNHISREPRLVGVSLQAAAGPRATCSDIVARWRNAPRADDLPGTMRTLQIANASLSRPILLLGLDGLDETPEVERASAIELVSHFYRLHRRARASNEPPDGMLIVTCRDRDEIEELLQPLASGSEILPDVPGVNVDYFTDEEFAAVWSLWFAAEPLPRFGDTRDMFDTFADSIASAGRAQRLARALRHPAILGCTRSLTGEVRRRLVQGDEREWRRLLLVFHDWFARKASVRARRRQKTITAIIQAAVDATKRDATATYDLHHHWVSPALTETDQPKQVIRQVFWDAVSSGLVTTGRAGAEGSLTRSLRWRWQFPLLVEHFSSRP